VLFFTDISKKRFVFVIRVNVSYQLLSVKVNIIQCIICCVVICFGFSDVPSNCSLSKPETVQRLSRYYHLCKYAVIFCFPHVPIGKVWIYRLLFVCL